MLWTSCVPACSSPGIRLIACSTSAGLAGTERSARVTCVPIISTSCMPVPAGSAGARENNTSPQYKGQEPYQHPILGMCISTLLFGVRTYLLAYSLQTAVQETFRGCLKSFQPGDVGPARPRTRLCWPISANKAILEGGSIPDHPFKRRYDQHKQRS